MVSNVMKNEMKCQMSRKIKSSVKWHETKCNEMWTEFVKCNQINRAWRKYITHIR